MYTHLHYVLHFGSRILFEFVSLEPLNLISMEPRRVCGEEPTRGLSVKDKD